MAAVTGPERDLLVLGGGVTGLGLARLAARSGWSVTVVERDDLATGASSSTSHMLHGGLRYLEQGRFRLVREALAERMAVSRLAPALARPVRFLVPLRKGDRVGPFRLRAGLALYDLLAGRSGLSPHVLAGAKQALAMEPALEPDGLRAAGIYSDVVMDDVRIAIALARDAAAHGAEILPHTELVAARPEPSTGRQAVELRARGGVLRQDGSGGVRSLKPLLAAAERVGEASREHRIVDDGPLLTIAGGKYTTFRVMARDVFVAAARKLKRATPPAEDGEVALPTPLADAVGDEDLAAHALSHEWAGSLEDIVRRRSTRWLADDRGLAAARRMAPVLAKRFGWDGAREREEIDRFEASVRDELLMLDRALAAH